jgi:hypothetical protein
VGNGNGKSEEPEEAWKKKELRIEEKCKMSIKDGRRVVPWQE